MLVCPFINAQPDSLSMGIDQMSWQDVKPRDQILGSTKVISGGRFEKNINEIPFTIFVITGEEIRSNGYTTLTEALKMLPGIKTHEVGSAFDGSSFIMRGLYGNVHAKILINDVSIKPFLVGGMPLGAQLPIQQAERIEVLYGPAATIYGADATAGVINIITKSHSRPFTMNASINTGNYGYKSINLLFGIKKGSAKNPLEIDFYANNTSRDTRPIIYNVDSIYLNYEKSAIIDSLKNYITVEGKPKFGNLPHHSQSMGMRLKYFDFQLNFDLLSRVDHTALGMVPYSLSYASPLNFFGEDILSTNIIYQKNIFKNLTIKAIMSQLKYDTKASSTASYVLPTVGVFYELFRSVNSPSTALKDLEDNLVGGNRPLQAYSSEISSELILQYKPSNFANFSFGFSRKSGSGSPLIPIKYNPFTADLPFITNYLEYSGFGETNLRWKKINATIGLQLLKREDETTKFKLEENSIIYNPRIGILYELSSRLNVRGSMSKAFRNPSPYYNSSSVYVDAVDANYVDIAFQQFQSERTQHFDLGCRYNTSKFDLDVSVYNLQTNGLVNFIPESDSLALYLRWTNDSISVKNVYGAQLSASMYDLYKPLGWNARFNINYTFGNEKFTSSNSDFSTSQVKKEVISFDSLRAQPKWILKLQNEIKYKNWSLTIQNQWMSSVITSSISWIWNKRSNSRENPGFHLMDCNLKYKLTKNSQFRLAVFNVFNTQYAGTSADQTFESLSYNPQPLRTWTFGVDYNLN
ncbi:MAG: TonB-dependent receptor [Saprospiraceae bacterium]|nr:TonB-dependent receptor [Saprospiraceae bacterium]